MAISPCYYANRTSRTLDGKPVTFPSPTSTATTLAKGASHRLVGGSVVQTYVHFSILEYLVREDAERAVKDLDGKDLRGQQVRVTLQDAVSVQLSSDEDVSFLRCHF